MSQSAPRHSKTLCHTLGAWVGGQRRSLPPAGDGWSRPRARSSKVGEHRRRPAEMASFGNSKYQSGYLASRSRPAHHSSCWSPGTRLFCCGPEGVRGGAKGEVGPCLSPPSRRGLKSGARGPCPHGGPPAFPRTREAVGHTWLLCGPARPSAALPPRRRFFVVFFSLLSSAIGLGEGPLCPPR